MQRHPWHLWWAVLLCAAPAAWAQEPLTAEQVLQLAREAPPVRLAEFRVAESTGRLTDAEVWSTRNPELGVDAGPRVSEDTTLSVGVSLEIPVELWGQRRRRTNAARAEIDRGRHAVADVRRTTAGTALASFYRTVHARDVLRATREQAELSGELLRVAEERYRAGDIPLLHVTLARAERARAQSAVRGAEREDAGARTDLAQILGRPDVLELPIEGELADRSPFEAEGDRTPGADRPDLLQARARVRQVRAELSLAELDRLPETALSLTYEHEEGASILLGGFSVSLPVFNRGQGRRESLAATLGSARLAEEAARASIDAQLRGARLAYRSAVAAALELEERGAPLQAENARLALEAYGAGKIDLAALLLIRRESLELQREVLDRQLAACLAGVELAQATGALSTQEPTVPESGDTSSKGDRS
ncbi:MAG TPA: TolC family protein [Deferrisomatales bacterium]|nr:TolC family protein [Deferrisomatales bacterium]